jgi:hypothetical protein
MISRISKNHESLGLEPITPDDPDLEPNSGPTPTWEDTERVVYRRFLRIPWSFPKLLGRDEAYLLAYCLNLRRFQANNPGNNSKWLLVGKAHLSRDLGFNSLQQFRLFSQLQRRGLIKIDPAVGDDRVWSIQIRRRNLLRLFER